MQRRSSPTASGAPTTVTPLGLAGPSRFHTQRSTAAGGPLTVTSAGSSPASSWTANSPGPVRARHAAPSVRAVGPQAGEAGREAVEEPGILHAGQSAQAHGSFSQSGGRHHATSKCERYRQ